MGARSLIAGLGATALLGTGCAAPDVLEGRLQQMPHAYRTDWGSKPLYDSSPASARRLGPGQRAKAEALLEALRDRGFRRSIGAIIEEDLANGQTEHGGLIFRDGAGLRLRQYPSGWDSMADIIARNQYYIAPEDFERDLFHQPDCFAAFHLHAYAEDSAQTAGPSDGDLNQMAAVALRRPDACGVVITKLPEKAFNIDAYFVTPRTVRGLVVIETDSYTVVDLGSYRYGPE